MADNDEPFGQRKTGRRAQRRKAREEAERGTSLGKMNSTTGNQQDEEVEAAASSPSGQQVAVSKPPMMTTATGAAAAAAAAASAMMDYIPTEDKREKKKVPSDEIQSRIDAAISLRAGHGHAAASAMTADQQQHNSQQILPNQIMEPDVLEGAQYEYLDHTADVQLHSWGNDITDALGQLAVALFGYMTSLQSIEVDEQISTKVASNVVARGHDMHSLLFSFLDEWLFVFHDTGFIAREVEVLGFDRETFVIQSRGRGEIFNIGKHPQGTEVKAITYSNMQIQEEDNDGNGTRDNMERRCDIWVIVDI